MCDERERLIGYVYDECDSAERQVIDDHLASCETCRREIRALRSTRQDLLAWEIPAQPLVWRPMAPARVDPPWYAMPAWALAAAAVLILLAGAAGGAATYAVLPHSQPVVASSTASAAAVPASVSPTDLSAVEERVLATVRADLDERVRQFSVRTSPPRTTTSQVNPDELARQVNALRVQQDDLRKAVYGVYNETMGIKTKQSGLEQRNNFILTSLVQGQGSPQQGR